MNPHPFRSCFGALHQELLSFDVITSPRYPVILGHPWLCRHNHSIDWSSGQIAAWKSSCHKRCLQQVRRPGIADLKVFTTPDIPAVYVNYADVFSEKKRRYSLLTGPMTAQLRCILVHRYLRVELTPLVVRKPRPWKSISRTV